MADPGSGLYRWERLTKPRTFSRSQVAYIIAHLRPTKNCQNECCPANCYCAID